MFWDTSSTCAVPFALHSLMQRRTISNLSSEFQARHRSSFSSWKFRKQHVYITGLRQQNIFFPRRMDVILNYLVAIEFNACDAHVDWSPLVASPFLLRLLVSKRVRYITITVPWQDFGENCVWGFNTIPPTWMISPWSLSGLCLPADTLMSYTEQKIWWVSTNIKERIMFLFHTLAPHVSNPAFDSKELSFSFSFT